MAERLVIAGAAGLAGWAPEPASLALEGAAALVESLLADDRAPLLSSTDLSNAALRLLGTLLRASPTRCEALWRLETFHSFLTEVASRLTSSPSLYVPLVRCVREGVLGCSSGVGACERLVAPPDLTCDHRRAFTPR